MFDALSEYIRFWPYGAAALAGVPMRLVDARIGYPAVLVALVMVAVGGLLTMRLSPFTFGGGDHYFEGLIASLFAIAAVAGYAACALVLRLRKQEGKAP